MDLSGIIKAYDIRGIWNDTMNELHIKHIATHVASKLQKPSSSFLIGRDPRVSSPIIAKIFIDEILKYGISVIDIGLIVTPMLYYAMFEYDFTFGVMITGSHNPPLHNGCKMMFGKKCFDGDDIKAMLSTQTNMLPKQPNNAPNTQLKKDLDIRAQYVDSILHKSHIKASHNCSLKIIWDPGNGAVCNILPLLCTKLQSYINIKSLLINEKIDGNFSDRSPEPTEENIGKLISHVKSESCDVGFAFDGDGDRLAVVLNDGYTLSGDELLLVLAIDLLKKKRNAKIVVNVETNSGIIKKIRELGGIISVTPTGHSIIKKVMQLENADLGGEVSGHMFFRYGYYGFDDAIFAALKLISILAINRLAIKEALSSIQKYVRITKSIQCDNAFSIIEGIKKELDKEKISYSSIDGVRVEVSDSSWLIRQSNTENLLKITVDGHNEKSANNTMVMILSKISSKSQ